ncbi:MAG: alpha/beta fold hydrolase [Vibrio sp.]
MRWLYTVLLCVMTTACSMPPEIKENKVTAERVRKTPNLVFDHYVNAEGYKLHYVASEDFSSNKNDKDFNRSNLAETLLEKHKPAVVFIHGTPGGWGTFASYYEQPAFLDKFSVFSIDRPGWGESTYPNEEYPYTLQEQAELLASLIKDISLKTNQKLIVVGHSYGGSLVPVLAAEYPEYIRGAVILAGDIEPQKAEARWFNFTLDYVPDFLIPEPWAQSNKEVLAIAPSLEKLQSKFATIKQNLIIMQGTQDDLVRPSNSHYAPKIFSNAKLEVIWLYQAGHIINLTHVEEVMMTIKQLNTKINELEFLPSA